MKRRQLQQMIANLIETGIKEGISATDSTDMETWMVAQSLAEEILTCVESQGMQPPTCTIEKPLTPNMPIYDRHGKVTYKVQVNEWKPEDDQH
jgi:hypothetical protein